MNRSEHAAKLQCTFDDCFYAVEGRGHNDEAAVNNAYEKLIRHKVRNDAHDYCRVCDLDFKSFDDLVRHKAESSDKVHISCPWCGQDFKSHAGRNAHIAQSHPKEQNINCPGCGEHFGQTAAFVHHLEKGLCRTISGRDFVSCVRHKDFTYKALEAPGSSIKWDVKGLQDQAAEDLDKSGGVILDLSNQVPSGALQQPLQPQKKEYKVGPNVVNHFPPLRSHSATFTPSQISNKSALASSHLGNKAEDSWEEKLGNIRIARGKEQPATSSLNSKLALAERAEGDTVLGVWSKHAQSPRNDHFSSTKPLVQETVSWEGPSSDQKQGGSHGSMLDDMTIVNPDLPGFRADRFFNQIEEKYECPWAGCNAKCDSGPDLHTHLRNGHQPGEPKCPLCQKKFKSSSGLIAHCEAINGRCRVRDMRDYGAFIHRITGGFVSASLKERDDPQIQQIRVASDGLGGTTKVGTTYMEYIGQEPQKALEGTERNQGQPQVTQVTGNKMSWVPPHRRGDRMRG